MQILFEEELLVLRAKSGSIYPGVIKTMQALAEEYDLFVVSNSQDGYVQSFMRWSGLTCVRDIEMSGRTGLDKGSNIRLVMERNNITQAVYVGDTQKDAAAAEKAGIPFFSRNTGLVMHRMPRCGSAQSKSFHRPSRPHFPKTEKQKSLQRSGYYKSGQKP